MSKQMTPGRARALAEFAGGMAEYYAGLVREQEYERGHLARSLQRHYFWFHIMWSSRRLRFLSAIALPAPPVRSFDNE